MLNRLRRKRKKRKNQHQHQHHSSQNPSDDREDSNTRLPPQTKLHRPLSSSRPTKLLLALHSSSRHSRPHPFDLLLKTNPPLLPQSQRLLNLLLTASLSPLPTKLLLALPRRTTSLSRLLPIPQLPVNAARFVKEQPKLRVPTKALASSALGTKMMKKRIYRMLANWLRSSCLPICSLLAFLSVLLPPPAAALRLLPQLQASQLPVHLTLQHQPVVLCSADWEAWTHLLSLRQLLRRKLRLINLQLHRSPSQLLPKTHPIRCPSSALVLPPLPLARIKATPLLLPRQTSQMLLQPLTSSASLLNLLLPLRSMRQRRMVRYPTSSEAQ